MFAVLFLAGVVAGAGGIVAAALWHHARKAATPLVSELPDGNTAGDDLLTWCAEHPDRTHAPEYLED